MDRPIPLPEPYHDTVILGIDPGSRYTGYGLIALQGKTLHHLAHGVIGVANRAMPDRLLTIYDTLSEIIELYHPTEVAIEEVFVGKNAQSALILGQARGVSLLAAAKYELPIEEYATRTIKLANTGYGAASKDQIQYMVQRILKLSALPRPDAADALAVGLCHAQHRIYFKRSLPSHRDSKKPITY